MIVSIPFKSFFLFQVSAATQVNDGRINNFWYDTYYSRLHSYLPGKKAGL
jgi:hypothetical protein